MTKKSLYFLLIFFILLPFSPYLLYWCTHFFYFSFLESGILTEDIILRTGSNHEKVLVLPKGTIMHAPSWYEEGAQTEEMPIMYKVYVRFSKETVSDMVKFPCDEETIQSFPQEDRLDHFVEMPKVRKMKRGIGK